MLSKLYIRKRADFGSFSYNDIFSFAIGPAEKQDRHKTDNARALHYYAAKATIENKSYYVRFVMRKYTNQPLYFRLQ